MNTDTKSCFFCDELCEHGRNNKMGAYDEYICPNCGYYGIGYFGMQSIINSTKDNKHIIAGYLFETKGKRNNEIFMFTTESIDKILNDSIIPKTIMQKLEKILLYYYNKNNEIGYYHSYRKSHGYAMGYAKSCDEMCSMIEELQGLDFIKFKSPTDKSFFKLSAKGHTYAEKITVNECSQIHAAKQNNYDVFISLASDDKATFVTDFENALQSKGLTTFYDKISIAWGESVVGKISEGLSQSTVGVVIISKYFIEKAWTNAEIDALTTLMINNKKRILPILHEISYEEMARKYPLIAPLSCRDSSKHQISDLADELFGIYNTINNGGL